MIKLKCKKCGRNWYTSALVKMICKACGGELKEVNMHGPEKKKPSPKKRNKSTN